MFLTLLALLVLPLSTQSRTPAAPPAAVQTGPVTPESLIPANSLAVFRIRSVDSLEKSVQAIVPGAPVGQQLLGGLMLATEVPALPIDQIDRTAPLLVAACPSQVHPPVELMLILTCKDPAAFTAPLAKAGWTCTTNGKLVACSPSKPGPALAADAPMRSGLDKNDVVLRIAMEEAMSQFGELLHAGIDQAAEELGSEMASKPGGDNASAVVSGIGDALDEIEIFEINVSQRGDQTRLGFEMTALDGSDLAKVAKVDASALPTAARAISTDGAVSMLAMMDFSKISGMFKNLMDAALKEMSEEQRHSFAPMIDMSMELYADVGPTVAGSYDFDEHGMHGSTWMNVKDPAAYMTKMLGMVGKMAPWMLMTGPEHVQVSGSDVSTYRIKLDLDKMPAASTGGNPMSAEEKAQAQKMLASLFGPDGMMVSMTPNGGGLVAVLGSLDEMKSTMTRMSSKSLSPLATDLMREMGNMNPGIVMRLDMGKYMAGLASLSAAMPEEEKASFARTMGMMRSFPPIQLVGGVEGRVWKFGLSTDVTKIIATASSMKDAVMPKNTTAMSPERARALVDIMSISTALDAYALNNTGDYPDSLDALVKPDENGKRYFDKDKLPLDPWGRAYVYTKPWQGHPQPRVASLGADGKEGGTGADADIDNDSEDHDDR